MKNTCMFIFCRKTIFIFYCRVLLLVLLPVIFLFAVLAEVDFIRPCKEFWCECGDVYDEIRG